MHPNDVARRDGREATAQARRAAAAAAAAAHVRRQRDVRHVHARRPPALADGKPTAVDEMAALAAEEAARGGMCPLPDL